MKYVASAHDRICEQWVRPSHLNVGDAGRSLVTLATGAAMEILDLYCL